MCQTTGGDDGIKRLGLGHQDDQTTHRFIGWITVLPRVPSHMLRCRCATSFHPFAWLTFPQLHFALTDATYWMSQYSGFDYEEFYEFIVDYFEADVTPQAYEISANLLDWWNKYISSSTSIPAATDDEYFPGKSSRNPQPCVKPHPLQDDEDRLPSCDSNARPPAHLTHPHSSS